MVEAQGLKPMDRNGKKYILYPDTKLYYAKPQEVIKRICQKKVTLVHILKNEESTQKVIVHNTHIDRCSRLGQDITSYVLLRRLKRSEECH